MFLLLRMFLSLTCSFFPVVRSSTLVVASLSTLIPVQDHRTGALLGAGPRHHDGLWELDWLCGNWLGEANDGQACAGIGRGWQDLATGGGNLARGGGIQRHFAEIGSWMRKSTTRQMRQMGIGR
jgi:hypothetical protein